MLISPLLEPQHLEGLPGSEVLLAEDNANIVFRLDDELQFIHEREASKQIWEGEFGKDNTTAGVCLLNGEKTS